MIARSYTPVCLEHSMSLALHSPSFVSQGRGLQCTLDSPSQHEEGIDSKSDSGRSEASGLSELASVKPRQEA